MMMMSGSVGCQFSVVYTAIHKAVVVIIPPIDCTIHVKFQKLHSGKIYSFCSVPNAHKNSSNFSFKI